MRIWCLTVLAILASSVNAQTKSQISLDEFFNSVSFSALEMSPDGNSVVIGTERANWDKQIFSKDLWLYRHNGSQEHLIQLTEFGHATEPKWSPDGKWIAFLSSRDTDENSPEDEDTDESGAAKDSSKNEDVDQIYLISPNGGEAFAVTEGSEEVHAFAWSADSKTLFYSTRIPWTKEKKDAYRKEWKDVVQYRTAERGDSIFALELSTILSNRVASPATERSKAQKHSDVTLGARLLVTSPFRVEEIVVSPDGNKLAFVTNPINRREEKYGDYEIYVAAPTSANDIRIQRLTRNQAVEHDLRWANDSRHIFFTIDVGDTTGPYRDLQPHLYWVDAETGALEQWSKDFIGSVEHFAVGVDGPLVSGRLGIEVQAYSAAQPTQSFKKVGGWAGTYEGIATATHSPNVAFVYSSLAKPAEVYLGESSSDLDHARPITSFNALFTQRELPQGKPYRWNADDGTTVEGMLIYPPGKFEEKHLPMFTFIHGGPADAWGNAFEADWYQWGILAAANGWLVFEPNYRGSSGYGDKFLQQIVPVIVSRPGKDILEGVDALIKDGIADPDHLVIGGYSYGGYMTNWLITQSTQWKAAVTGAGAVEHIANWGNDDTTFDDAYFLGGRPWEAPRQYHDEAAIFQINKVRTPTHMVAGADDIRVAVLEDYLLEHALYSLGIPNALLIFPGEGHSLDKNPWHGKIKVREELKWLQKYGGVAASE
ncbi:MAG TPA: prolyl oligopeptidase family serine peptidase [Terriglobales bacterium]|nr:prolyl oligopeptidase family serine peptidase [Terriglobales bacterium]